MSEYHLNRIFYRDHREMQKLDALLAKEGIERDLNLDYTVGLYDEEEHLAASGSCFGNTLRCMAVDSAHQGEGLLNQIVSHLIRYQYEQGTIDLFLYTKYDKAPFFGDLGFYEIARADGTVVFMENRKDGFDSYLKHLKKETDTQAARFTNDTDCRTGTQKQPDDTKMLPDGAVVMNANPFTLGHLHLLTEASKACRLLHVFVVSEDASLIPFKVRFRLVCEGSAHLYNLVYHRTGSYLISNATFPSYFLKDSDTVIEAHAGLDTAVFGKIAEALGITVRFAGEEPASRVTGIYNEIMAAKLPQYGVDCRIIPRVSGVGGIISASTVREQVKGGNLDRLKELVPECTYRYFLSEEAQPVIRAIREAGDVRHY